MARSASASASLAIPHAAYAALLPNVNVDQKNEGTADSQQNEDEKLRSGGGGVRPVGERLSGNGVGRCVSAGREPGQRERVEPHRLRVVPPAEGRIALFLQLPRFHPAFSF
jgi:hypothetical protein